MVNKRAFPKIPDGIEVLGCIQNLGTDDTFLGYVLLGRTSTNLFEFVWDGVSPTYQKMITRLRFDPIDVDSILRPL